MAAFDCNRCGKCCRSFGKFIRIERKISDRDYYCRYGITNELFFVHVQPEFAEEILDEFSTQGETEKDTAQKGCIFLQKDAEGRGAACAVYPTRPPFCREFRCYRMLIYHNKSGELRGKVIGTGELRTEDEGLVALWKEKVSPLPHPVECRDLPAQPARSRSTQAAQGNANHIRADLYSMSLDGDRAWVNNVITILAAHGYRGDPVDD